MNDTGLVHNKSDDWKSWSPEFFLTNLRYELRTHIMAIKGYTTILSNENMKEYHPQALERISKNIQSVEELCDGIAAYRNELGSRNNT